MRRSLITAIAFAAMLVLAPAANASTVTDNGQDLTVLAGVGEANGIVVTVSGNSATITDSAGIGIGSPSGTCTPSGPPNNEINCTMSSSGGRVVVATGDLNDSVVLNVGASTGGPIEPRQTNVDTGTGNDTVNGSGSGVSQFIEGGDGDDTMIGGPRGDFLNRPVSVPGEPLVGPGPSGGFPDDPGNDRITGGGGNDFISAKSGAEVVDSGEGYDLIETLPSGPNATSADGDLHDDNAVDTITCGGNTPLAGDVPRPPSAQLDTASVGKGDLVGADCEALTQFVDCPAGASCAGNVSVEAGGAAGAAGALASVAKKKGKKKPLVLGRTKVKVSAGQSELININVRPSKVNKALGKSTQVPATMRFNVKRVKKGKQVGKLKKKVRFKLKR